MKAPGPQPFLPIIQLNPGKGYFSDQPEIIATILGSCLTIILHNTPLRITAACHAQLPLHPLLLNAGIRTADVRENRFKFVDSSLLVMYNWMKDHGLQDCEIDVKLFGGGDVLQVNTDKYRCDKRVGLQNIETALRVILDKGLRITAIDVGGESGRKLFIYTHTGEVYLKKLGKTDYQKAHDSLAKIKAEIGKVEPVEKM